MRYERPSEISRDRLIRALDDGTEEEIQEAIVGLALNDPDWRWVQNQCLALLEHNLWSIRAIAATCLGHIARIHGELDGDRVIPALHQLLGDRHVSGYIEEVLSDIKIYLGIC